MGCGSQSTTRVAFSSTGCAWTTALARGPNRGQSPDSFRRRLRHTGAVITIVADAGFSECTPSGVGCLDGVWWSLVSVAVTAVGVVVWLSLAFYVTVSATTRRPGRLPNSRIVVSVVAAWAVPIIGSAVYFWNARSAKRRMSGRSAGRQLTRR